MNPGVQGLRGVAISLVVLFHLGVQGFGGGNLGVDVFFVISGFVITQRLVGEQLLAGRINLASFFARRIRRLLPVSTLVIGTILVYLVLRYPSIVLEGVRSEAQAATLGVSNVWAAFNEADYGGARFGPFVGLASPFAHLWSLAVEEQFYLLFAPLVALLLRLSTTRWSRFLRLPIVLSVLALMSVATSFIVGSGSRPTFAFFLLDSRGWQLLAGALLALVPTQRLQWPAWAAETAASTGLLLLAVVVHRYQPSGGRPSLAPIAAVVSASLIIAAVQRPARRPLGRLLQSRPLTFLGAIAYPLYLWHWFILIVFDVTPGSGTLGRLAVVVLVSVALAAASHRLLEIPIGRRSPSHQPTARTFALGLCAVATLFAAATFASSFSSDVGDASSTSANRLPRDLQPSLNDLFGSAQPVMSECSPESGSQATSCITGSLESDRRIAIVGDSHAEQWVPALAIVGTTRGLQVFSYSEGGCHWTGLGRAQNDDGCDLWHQRTVAALTERPPDIVLLAGDDEHALASIGRVQYRKAAVHLRKLLSKSTQMAILGDIPIPDFDLGTCLVRNWSDLSPCDLHRSRTVDSTSNKLAHDTAISIGAQFVDTSLIVCPHERCRPVRGNVLMYRDYNHLSVEFARTQGPALGTALGEILGQ